MASSWEYYIGVFYFQIEPKQGCGADEFVWVVIGDMPTAYIDIESAKNEAEALYAYILLMEDWIQKVKDKKSVKDCYPVNAPPTNRNASKLKKRVKIIRRIIDMIREKDVLTG